LDALAKQEVASVSAEKDGHKVVIKGVRATYDDVKPYLSPARGLFPQGARKSLLWLGSSLGNFTRQEAADFLKSFAEEGLQPQDSFLIGIDSTSNVTERFVLNGIAHIESIFAENNVKTNFKSDKFTYVHRFNVTEGCHEVRSSFDGIAFK